MAPSASGTKRSAPSAQGPQTLPPNLRTQSSQPSTAQFPTTHSMPGVAHIPHAVTGSRSTGLPAHIEAIMAQPVAGFPNEYHRAIAFGQIRHQLSALPQQELVEFVMSLADKSVELRMAVQDQTRKVKEAEAAKLREAEEKRRKAQQRKLSKPLNYSALLRRVEKDMFKETPFSWSYEREMDEGIRVAYGIEKTLKQFVGHCTAASSSDIKLSTMATVMEIWGTVIFAPCSYTRKQCLMDSVMWEEPTLELWGRLSLAEKKRFCCSDKNVERMVEVGIEWKNHCVREEMFDKWIQDMKVSADGASSEHLPHFAKWDARNAPKESRAGIAGPTTTPAFVDLTV